MLVTSRNKTIGTSPQDCQCHEKFINTIINIMKTPSSMSFTSSTSLGSSIITNSIYQMFLLGSPLNMGEGVWYGYLALLSCLCRVLVFSRRTMSLRMTWALGPIIQVIRARVFEHHLSRWWFHFFFHPGSLGMISNLTSIFFKWVETIN